MHSALLKINSQLNDYSTLSVSELANVWSVLTKVKNELADGRRCENVAWRLWFKSNQKQSASTNLKNALCEIVQSSPLNSIQSTKCASREQDNIDDKVQTKTTVSNSKKNEKEKESSQPTNQSITTTPTTSSSSPPALEKQLTVKINSSSNTTNTNTTTKATTKQNHKMFDLESEDEEEDYYGYDSDYTDSEYDNDENRASNTSGGSRKKLSSVCFEKIPVLPVVTTTTTTTTTPQENEQDLNNNKNNNDTMNSSLSTTTTTASSTSKHSTESKTIKSQQFTKKKSALSLALKNSFPPKSLISTNNNNNTTTEINDKQHHNNNNNNNNNNHINMAFTFRDLSLNPELSESLKRGLSIDHQCFFGLQLREEKAFIGTSSNHNIPRKPFNWNEVW